MLLSATPVRFDLRSNFNPAPAGSDIMFTTAVGSTDPNVTTTPTGTVTFFDGTTSLGSLPLSHGVATFDAGTGLAGSNTITVQYSGDSIYAAGTSSPLIQTFLSPTVTSLVSSDNPAVVGDDVVFTATVSGNDGAADVPRGDVEFFDNGTDLGGGILNSSAVATLDTTSLAVGSHSITAHYESDGNFSGSISGTLMQTVSQPALVVVLAATSLPGAIVAGTPVRGHLTVALTNQAAGVIVASRIDVLASIDGSIVDAIPVVSQVSKQGIRLSAHRTKNVNLPIKSFPATLATGSYTLFAKVTTKQALHVASATGPSVSIAAPFVDLAGKTGTGTIKPTPAKPGKTVTLTIALINSGNISSGAATLDIGLSVDGQTESIVLENPHSNIRIKPGKTGVLRLHLRIPSTVAAGSYQPFVSIDDSGDSTTIIGPAFTVATSK